MNIVQKLIDADREDPKRIAVVGDAVVDVWIEGTLRGCQDGCSCVDVSGIDETPGGAANAARQLENWSCSAELITPGGFKPHKTRYVVGGTIVFRSDRELPVYGMSETSMARWRGEALSVVLGQLWDAVLLSDYDKGSMTPEFIRAIIDHCNRKGIVVVADPKREPSWYRGAVIKCNDDYRRRYLQVPFGESGLVSTRGPLAPYFWEDGTVTNGFSDGPPVTCINHVGAGDCFAAHLALSLAHGFSLVDAAAVAHSAGRVYVQRPRGRPPLPSEVSEDFDASRRQLAPGIKS